MSREYIKLATTASLNIISNSLFNINSKPNWATRQQAIAKTPAKWSAYQIPSVTVVFEVLVFKVKFVSFYSQKPQETLN
jgi:hypothetical protein